MTATRTLVIWCADWSVLALGRTADRPAAVLEGNRVLAATEAARREGVTVGMGRRDAQGHCPDMDILERDVDREARSFEVVVAAASCFTPWVELSWPGSCAMPTRGPSRYFGGDHALVAAVRQQVLEALGGSRWGGSVGVGVADGIFAARLAARLAAHPATHPGAECQVIEPGRSPDFLAPMPLTVLDPPELVDVLLRLGLHSLGELAALKPASMLGRFGRQGERAQRLANGHDDQPLDARPPPADLSVSLELDPPVEHIDQAAFAAKMLADRLVEVLDDAGWTALRVAVEAETCHGEHLLRLWRHEGGLSPSALAERVRWQLEGWLAAGSRVGRVGPTAGLSHLRLIPDQVVPAKGRQLDFWGGQSEAALRAARAAGRVAALLGPEAVRVVEPRGGRSPEEQFRFLAATAVDLQERSDRAWGDGASAPPWPGRLPTPSPAVVLGERRRPARLADQDDRPVQVSARGVLEPEPRRLWLEGWASWRSVQAWAGPWPLEERWWDHTQRRRQARLQVVVEDHSAWLLVLEEGRWWAAAAYD